MNNLPVYLKNLSILGVTTMLLGMSHPTEITTVDLASTQPASSTKSLVKTQVNPLMDPALLTATINRVFNARKIPSLMMAPATKTSATATCPNCSAAKAVSDIRYEQCREDKNDYLESIVEKTSSHRSILGQLVRLPLQKNTIIKPSCIQISLESTKLFNNFRSCNGSGYSSKRIRPCVSEGYLKLVSNSFDLVSKCMKDYVSPGSSPESQKHDIMAAYAMLNHESSMHVNAVSSTSAGGVGQFTEPAIVEVNRAMSSLQNYLDSHKNNQCGDLSKEFLENPMSPSLRNACDRISIEKGNPVKNMIYSFAALRNARQYLNNNVFEDDVYSKYFALSTQDMAELKRSLMTWSHNTGMAGLTGPMYSLLKNQYSKSKKVSDVKVFLAQLKTYSKTHPFRTRGYNPSPSRLNEMANYFSNIQNDMSVIKGNVGGSCLN